MTKQPKKQKKIERITRVTVTALIQQGVDLGEFLDAEGIEQLAEKINELVDEVNKLKGMK